MHRRAHTLPGNFMRSALLAPALILCGLFLLWPMVEVVRLSLTSTNFIVTKYVGLANYAKAFTSPAFLRSVANSGLYILLIVPGQVVAALLIVLSVMDLPKWWHDGARFFFYIPALSAGIIIASIWRWMFHLDGPLNWALGTRVAWWASGATAIPAVSIVMVASTLGGVIIILLAAVLSIDRDLYDAAKMDGARPRQIKWRIVVPIIAPTIWLMALLAAIAAPQIFETVYALAPYEYSATMAYHIWSTAFQMSRYGQASAQAIVLLALMLVMAWGKGKVAR